MFRLALKHGFCEKIKTRRRRVEVNTVYFCSLTFCLIFVHAYSVIISRSNDFLSSMNLRNATVFWERTLLKSGVIV